MDEPWGYSRICTACGAQINHCNMYGMGTCGRCGFKDNPVQRDNNANAAAYRLRHPELFPLEREIEEEPVGIDIGILCGQISQGSFDPDLDRIQDAIRDRNTARREEVLEQVREVWGPDATISMTKIR